MFLQHLIYTGYVLTEDSNKFCIKRKGENAVMIKCDKGYSGLSLQCILLFYFFFCIIKKINSILYNKSQNFYYYLFIYFS